MEYSDNYKLELLNNNDIEEYTKKLVEAFAVEDYYGLYLEDNLFSYQKGYYFLGARLNSDKSLIGGACFERKPMYRKEIFIENIFVVKAFRHQGVATNILEYIIINKSDLFKQPRIDLKLFCEEELQSFYEERHFEMEDCYQRDEQKVLRMGRKI